MKMRYMIDLNKFRRQLREAGKISDQELVAQEQKPTVESEIAVLESGVIATTRQFHDEYERRSGETCTVEPFTVSAEHYLALVLLVGAVVVVILEILVSIPIAQSWLNLPPAWAFTTGAIVGTLLSLAFKAGIGVLCRVDDHLRPQAPRRRLWLVGLVNFVITAGLIGVILSSRTPSESLVELIETLTGLSLGPLGIALPLFAGSLMILAHDLDWSHRYDVEYHSTIARLGVVRGYLAYLSGYSAANPTTNPSPQTNP